MDRQSLVILSGILLVMLLSTASARPEYISQTGQPCSTCHINSTIGELNDMGKDFSVTHQWPPDAALGTRFLASTVGFMHLLASMILVGSMFFVHMIHTAGVLAVSGVPKKELRLGWISLFFIGISGIYLTVTRFPDLGSLLNTYPGRLVVGKIILFGIMVTFASLVTLVLNKKLKESPLQHRLVEEMEREMTLEELKKFNGSSEKAFVAYTGVVFDVTQSRLWKNGVHMRKHHAGEDLTLAFMEAPHATDVLDRFQAVARITSSKRRHQSVAVRLFKTMAVVNFIIALLAVLLSTLLAWPL